MKKSLLMLTLLMSLGACAGGPGNNILKEVDLSSKIAKNFIQTFNEKQYLIGNLLPVMFSEEGTFLNMASLYSFDKQRIVLNNSGFYVGVTVTNNQLLIHQGTTNISQINWEVSELFAASSSEPAEEVTVE